ncbi:MAG: hypothetical protein WAV07_01960 [Candidatus Contendobacter sp.]
MLAIDDALAVIARWPPLPPSALSPLERRVAERLRADLPGQTPLGCGSRALAGTPR